MFACAWGERERERARVNVRGTRAPVDFGTLMEMGPSSTSLGASHLQLFPGSNEYDVTTIPTWDYLFFIYQLWLLE